MNTLVTIFGLLVVAGLLWVRLAPHDAGRWHTDPRKAEAGRAGGYALRPGGDAEPPVLPLSPAEVLAQIDQIALATPRTSRLAGSPEAGQITYVTRSKLIGFPDYTTVAADAAEAGARPIIDARLRFGHSDMGVNKARVQDWLARLQAK